jgi:hypothetical protein
MTQLRGLKVTKIDLVPDGDNPLAKVTMYKARAAKASVDCPKCGKAMPEGGTCPECGYSAKARPAPARKDGGNPPTCGELLDARNASDELSKLHWAFSDSMYGILWSGAANKTELLKQSVDEFGQRLKAITGEIDGTMKSIPETDPEKFITAALEQSEAAIQKARDKAMKKIDLNAIPEAQRGLVVELQAAHEALTKERDTLKGEVATLKATPPAPTPEDDLAGVPEVTKTRILKERADAKATAERVAKLEETNDVNARVAKVRTDHPTLKATTPDLFGALLYRVEKNKATAEDVAELERVVKALSVQAKAAGPIVTKESGSGASDDAPADPAELVKTKALALMKENPGKFASYDRAVDHLVRTDPEVSKALSN